MGEAGRFVGRNVQSAARFVGRNVKSIGNWIGGWFGHKSREAAPIAIPQFQANGPSPNVGNIGTNNYFGGGSNTGSNWATATLGFISADVMIPDPTDVAWPKWAGYTIAGGAAATYLYSGGYIEKMNREIEGIMQRTLGPPGFVYELAATRSGYYPNLNTGGKAYLNKGDVWKFGQTTKGFGRYTQSKLESQGLEMIPLPPGGNQMEILIQEKYYIYGYYFSYGHRPPGNPIFR